MKEYLSNNSHINLVTHRLVHYENTNEEVSHRLTIPESNIVLCLLKQQNTVVKKDELLIAGWGSQVVGDNSLNVAIYRIRKFLSDNQRISLENVPKVGYQLVIKEQSSLQSLNNVGIDSTKETEDIGITPVKDVPVYIESSGLKPKLKQFFPQYPMIVAIVLLVANILIVQIYVIIMSNAVNVQCEKNSNAIVCFSSGYYGDVELERSGLAVVSNMFSFSNDQVVWGEN